VPNEPYRAGAYRLGAFHPAPLPLSPSIRMDAALQRQLSDANLALGRLDGAIQTLPNPGHFVLMYIRKEAVLSSQIEGTQSSLTDLLAAEAEVLADDAPRDVDEVVNYINALNYGLKRLDTLPVSVRLVREIHERLLAGVRGGHLSPGALRTTQNWIGPM
jgi:Fic family protein